MVCVSGGVPITLPLILEAKHRHLPITNDSQIFMESVKAPVIGITGSAGKTTTTTLVGRIAREGVESPHKVWVGGNIGLPLVEYLDEIQAQDSVILELSSFQLEQMTLSPQIAVVLNITPNHLDRHGTMRTYLTAKARILEFQKPSDIAILNRGDIGSWGLRNCVQGKLITFGLNRPAVEDTSVFVEQGQIILQEDGKAHKIMPENTSQLRGEHNLLNILAACAIAHAAKLPFTAMEKGVQGFTGVEHRLELVRSWNGILWFNDSIATAPERTMAAINSFSEPIVLLLGGRDKNLPWDEIAVRIRKRVKHVIIFGESAEKIVKAVGSPNPGDSLTSVKQAVTFSEALEEASKIAKKGDVVLLSPGCTSFDAFRDFEERGNFYKKWVNQLS
jgi:UDP-N-acetylmuramoylalanine--D-glutamate ligase